jgi:hypothetical protein
VLVFSGPRAIHPAGIRGILRDAFVDGGAGRIRGGPRRCFWPFSLRWALLRVLARTGRVPELEVAVGRYNARHESSMESLVERAESLGLTRAEKNLLDRQSARAARDLLGPNLESACRPLPARFDSHEFDPAD